MIDFLGIFDLFKDAWSEVGGYIISHWYAFLVLSVLLIAAVVCIYKLISRKKNPESENKEVDKASKKTNKEDLEYNAYLVANRKTGEDLDDSNMFSNYKRAKKNKK